MKELPMADMQFIQDALDRRALLSALRAFRKGDFSVRLPMDLSGIDGEIAQIFNDVVEANEKMAEEFARICDDVGRKGQVNQRIFPRLKHRQRHDFVAGYCLIVAQPAFKWPARIVVLGTIARRAGVGHSRSRFSADGAGFAGRERQAERGHRVFGAIAAGARPHAHPRHTGLPVPYVLDRLSGALQIRISGPRRRAPVRVMAAARKPPERYRHRPQDAVLVGAGLVFRLRTFRQAPATSSSAHRRSAR